MKIAITVVITFVLTALVAAGLIGAMASGGKLKEAAPAAVELQTPVRGDLIEFVSARAEVQPKTKLSISARVAARIHELPFDEGDAVTKGDPDADPPIPASVVVKLDATALEAALESAEARRAASAAQIEVEKARIAAQRSSIKGLRATLARCGQDLERQRTLLLSKDVSQSTVDEFECRVQELTAQIESSENSIRASELNLLVLGHHLEAADAAIRQARYDLSYTTITSTIDGVVTRLHAEEGEMVVPGTMNNPGTVIAEVADLSQMLLEAEVDETDVGRLEVGQKALAHVHSYPGEPFEGTVESIALTHRAGRTGTKYFLTEVALHLDGRRVYTGSTADVDIFVQEHHDMLTLPSQAVLERLVEDLPVEIREQDPNVDVGKAFTPLVFRLVDGKAVATPVKIGASDETRTAILAGLEDDARVIVGPYKVLEELRHDQAVVDKSEAEGEGATEGDASAEDPEEPSDA